MRSAAWAASATAAAAAALVAAPMAALVRAQSTDCISLRNSKMCPAFENSYIKPSNLSSQYAFMDNVTDLSSFDSQFALYFNATDSEYYEQQISIGLQCNRSGSNFVRVQWERTYLCGQFSEQSFQSGCTTGQTNPTVVCEETCTQHASSAQQIVDNPVECAPTERLYPNHNETRSNTLAGFNATCTSWNNLVTDSRASCVVGLYNEPNCGYGASVSAQLCASCDPSGNRTVPSCCTAQNTTLTDCGSFGFPGAAAIVPASSSTSTSMSSTSMHSSSSSSSGGAMGTSGSDRLGNAPSSNDANLTKGQLAGILVGSLIGAILLGLLLGLLLCGRKRKRDEQSRRLAGGAVYGGAGNARSSSGDKTWTQSEEGMSRTMAASPDAEKRAGGFSNAPGAGGMGGNAAGAPGSNTGTYLGLGALGAGAAGAAGAAAAGSANRDSQGRPTSEALTSSSGGGEGRGTTVTSVRDQYTGQDIRVGEDVVAIYPYNASLNDEITLEPEQHLTILRLYDDGWALGRTQDGHEGALPLVCVSSTKGDAAGRLGAGTGTSTGTTTGTSDDEGLTSGNEYTSSMDGAVTAEEGATSDARSNRSRGNVGR